MKSRTFLLVSTLCILCISTLSAQKNDHKELALQFIINDQNNKPLTGRLTVSIDVTRGGDSAYLNDLYLGSGNVSAFVNLAIQKGGSGTILITYNPAEEPLNIYTNTAIVDSIEFISNRITFTLPDNNELIFKIYPEVKEIEVVSRSKVGAIRTLSKTKELSSSVKAYLELEASALVVSEKMGIEVASGEINGKSVSDTELSEDEIGTRYTVKYPTGALIIEQENVPK